MIHRHGGPRSYKPEPRVQGNDRGSSSESCGECGRRLIWAPTVDFSGSAELVCPSCGLVYSYEIDEG